MVNFYLCWVEFEKDDYMLHFCNPSSKYEDFPDFLLSMFPSTCCV